jgi:hypothetical protein
VIVVKLAGNWRQQQHRTNDAFSNDTTGSISNAVRAVEFHFSIVPLFVAASLQPNQPSSGDYTIAGQSAPTPRVRLVITLDDWRRRVALRADVFDVSMPSQ